MDLVPQKELQWNAYENTFKCRIVRLDRQRANVSISRKEVLMRTKTAELKETLKNIKEGDIIENATVRAIPDTKFGAFIDIGNNVVGLLHQSDISWNLSLL